MLNKTQYSYNSRFEEGPGTNPEELIAAAHAGCFTMKLSFVLQEAGFTADTITKLLYRSLNFLLRSKGLDSRPLSLNVSPKIIRIYQLI